MGADERLSGKVAVRDPGSGCMCKLAGGGGGSAPEAQLHGTEDEAYMEMLRSLVPGCEIWKACKIRSAEDLQKIENSSADRILLDNGYGTGNCFDWRLLKDWSTKHSFLLAGGLQSENIKEALKNFAPWGVDISSGVETDKKKDPDKIRKIIEQVRSK